MSYEDTITAPHFKCEFKVLALDDVPAELFKSLGISRPSSIGAGGDAAIVVEVYALGRGVSIERKHLDLSHTQCAFELETHDQFFVIDPDAAIKINGFVTPVERNVMPSWQPIEAVDQKNLAKFTGYSRHDATFTKTVILSLPQGAGKSTIAQRLAARLGCFLIVDEWRVGQSLIQGALHLTQQGLDELFDGAI